MRNIILSTVLMCVLTAQVFAQLAKAQVEEVNIQSKELNQTRKILIYKPRFYNEKKFGYYDVIYVFDAQNREFFDYTSSLAHLIKGKKGRQEFIVVGIQATFTKKPLYFRNLDFLPSNTKFFRGKFKGNSEKFLAYVKNEVVPYVESNYRTLHHRTAVGHSLGASFLISTLLKEPNLFDNYIAVSPNMAYDNQRLVQGLRAFDTKKLTSRKYLYLSHAREAKHWKDWGAAYVNAFPLLKETLACDKFRVTLEKYPEEDHMGGFVPSLTSALKLYLNEIEPVQRKQLPKKKYKITIQVKVPQKEGDLYISGNQESLGNWKPRQVKMKKVSPTIREITLKVLKTW